MKDLSHIMMIEIEETWGSTEDPIVVMPKVVLYNEKMITPEQLEDVLHRDLYDPNVLVIPKEQWLCLFCNEQTSTRSESDGQGS